MSKPTRRHLLAGAAAAAAVPAVAVPRAQAAAPLAEKQNPGWYHYKVGSFEVTVVTDGMTTAALADNYVGNASKSDVNATLVANHLPPDKVTHSYSPVVVNTGSKLVAIDTGLGLGMYQQSKGAVGQYHTNLAAAGIDPKNVDAVIISHFHADHINGLLGPDNKLAFPNAELLVPPRSGRSGWTRAMRAASPNRSRASSATSSACSARWATKRRTTRPGRN